MSDPNDLPADSSHSAVDSPSRLSKPYSCVVCHRRKVKCDRQSPCSNCAKANVECVYQAPPPPRRRKRERDTNGSVFQEREKSLRRTSAQPLSHEDAERYSSQSQIPTVRVGGVRPDAEKNGSGRMIMKEGNTVYLDKLLPNAADVLDDVSDSGTDNHVEEIRDEFTVLMGPGSRKGLAELHPNPLHIFKLWQTFLENVNPLTKIVHAPSLQQRILEAMGNLPTISRELEALMFSIYCIALVSMQADDVEKAFGEGKRALLSRCRRGAQLAFRNASILRTSRLMVLQAFMLYLLSMRAFSDPHTVWSLCGVAIRIAQRIGLHRDGSGYGLSVFETEMRRRIWFQLLVLDVTSAQLCGVASAMPLATNDVKPPININDSDLDPRMTEPPHENPGPTEMIFCLARSRFGKWLRHWSKDAGGYNGPWALLSSSSISLAEKDQAIDQLEEEMEQNVLRHCDRSIPLHLMTTIMVRSAIYYTRLMAHHPRQYREPNDRVPEAEKGIIFENCLKMTEFADYAQNSPAVQGFSWHMVNHMPWDAIIFMLSEMRHRNDPQEKGQVWQLIGSIYPRHLRQLGKNAQSPLHMAIQNLMVKAWKAYIEECNLHQRTPTPCPTIVTTLIGSAKDVSESQSAEEMVSSVEPGAALQGQPSHDLPSSHMGAEAENLFFFGESPMDWDNWDNLLNQFQESVMDDATLMIGSLS
ncbi:hypothetical protein NUU61_000606 [Penicillium alfredii]|uniref:Zn(2)-C6 fungal-type domain-containing protein n=1 Tax=Penicillium alfredii TaxID=1506179 RepID=A0A9W9GB43_9EURO|nr:uncharacterized protein NUU61_000606 [Penicillium alfredii]KAJ5114847.1 hypothetical protein NUU61_000606 [Penicillium alfredii]